MSGSGIENLLNYYRVNHSTKKAPSARGQRRKNVLKNAEIFNIAGVTWFKIVTEFRAFPGHIAVGRRVNR